MIKAQDISLKYGAKTVLHSVSFEASAGELIGLVGPNGSGKTSLLKCLLGLNNYGSGRIDIDGKDLQSLPLRQRAKTLAYLAQSASPAWQMSVMDIVRLGRAPYRGALGRLSQTGHAAVDGAIAAAQLSHMTQRSFETLSGGEKARVLLARALAVQAPILLADEPLAALDPQYQIRFMQLLKQEAARGTCVITALHDLPLASEYCDRILVLGNEELIAFGTPEQALSDQVLADIFGIKRPKGGFTLPQLSAP